MGLNTNFHLLMEDKSSACHIPGYTNYRRPDIFTEEFMWRTLSEFNEKIGNIQDTMSNVSTDRNINTLVRVSSAVTDSVSRTRVAILDLMHHLNDNIDDVIKDLTTNCNNSGYSIGNTYNTAASIEKGLKYLSSDEVKVNIRPLLANNILTNFPDNNIIGEELCRWLADCTINDNSCFNTSKNEELYNSYNGYIESNREKMLMDTFGEYEYDPSSISVSSIKVGNTAFGSNEKSETPVNIALYLQAKDNIDSCSNVIDYLKNMKDNINKNYMMLINLLSEIESVCIEKIQKINYNTNTDYAAMGSTIIYRVSNILNVVRQVIHANYSLNSSKINRIRSCFCSNGDSYTVKKMCEDIIKVSNDPSRELDESTSFNGDKACEEFVELFNEFNTYTAILNTIFNEEACNGTNMVANILLEADDQNAGNDNNTSSSNNNQQSSTTTSQSNNQQKNSTTANNTANKSAFSIMDWLKTLIGKLGDTFTRLRQRYDELIVKRDGKGFWEKNKEAISKMNLVDTKVNQWYKFNIDIFSKSTFVKFDINSADIKSDEAFQEAILRNITSNPPQAADNESFGDRIKKVYQGEYINDENGDGKTLNEIGYDHTSAYTFIDDMCMKGFGGDTLGNMSEDYKKIDADYKEVSKNYNSIAEKMPSESASDTADKKAAEADNKPAEPQKESAITEEHFNLAEYFGLVHHEATFNVGQDDAKNASSVMGTESTDNKRNKELDAMIKRCFNYNTIAITAKMTAAMACYKQYMGLFKAVYKGGGGKSEPKKEENTAAQKKPEENKK